MMAGYIKRNEGISLMEVLISALVLSIGLLGLAGLQVAGVKSNHSVYYRTQATILSTDIMDRMRSNSKAAREGEYNKSNLDSVPTDAAASSAQKDVDLYEWKKRCNEILPSFVGSIDCTGDGVCRVTVQWDDSRPEAQLDAGVTPSAGSRKLGARSRSFTMRSRI